MFVLLDALFETIQYKCFCIFKNTLVALNEVMNRCLSPSQIEQFQKMVGWSTIQEFNFKTFCGICALCERLLASECPPGMPPKKIDPCHEVSMQK